MAAALIPLLFLTIFWGIIGIVIPLLIPKGPNRGLIRCILVLTAASCWLFWFCCYMSQINPLVGPMLPQKAVFMIAKKWGYKME
ncbi:V-type proton ATPase subunit e-like [Glossina fuscipes]|uniref:V-type proton ATPase subunit n=1 Tax=Glossina fuscipes TaxID=7396 RepID=A0A9C5ZMC1_9MUSC|nr:V-type proton ATPase subunit e-like [Glossina fuscipes]